MAIFQFTLFVLKPQNGSTTKEIFEKLLSNKACFFNNVGGPSVVPLLCSVYVKRKNLEFSFMSDQEQLMLLCHALFIFLLFIICLNANTESKSAPKMSNNGQINYSE